MAGKVPVVRQGSLKQAVPQFAILFVLMFTVAFLEPVDEWRWMAGTVIGLCIWMVTARLFLPPKFRKGMRLIHKKALDDAIPHFESCVAYLAKNPWLDRWRAVLMLSNSAYSYREMALINIAFCHSQSGRGREAKAIYEQILAEYPENGIASFALNMIRAVEGSGK